MRGLKKVVSNLLLSATLISPIFAQETIKEVEPISNAIDTTFQIPGEIKTFKDLENRIEPEPWANCYRNETFFIYLTGGEESRFLYHGKDAYKNLVESGIIKSENAFFIMNSLEGRLEEGLEKLRKYLKQKMDSQDQLMIYVSTHGTDITIEQEKYSRFSLDDTPIADSYFKKFFKSINPAVGIFLGEACHSGGGSTRLGEGNLIGISSSRIDESSWNNHDLGFGPSFIKSFYEFRKLADYNKDEQVSIQEAYDRAYSLTIKNGSEVDNKTGKIKLQHPQIHYENKNPSEVFLK